MPFESVARLSELPTDRGTCVRVGERSVGLYRVGERVFAMDDACPHAGFPLHEGRLEDGIVTCNGHGWEYDVDTGRPPGVAGEQLIVRYPVRVEGDQVLVDVAEPIRD